MYDRRRLSCPQTRRHVPARTFRRSRRKKPGDGLCDCPVRFRLGDSALAEMLSHASDEDICTFLGYVEYDVSLEQGCFVLTFNGETIRLSRNMAICILIASSGADW